MNCESSTNCSAKTLDSINWHDLRVFAVDVDGTLTDGGMYYTEAGEIMKRFYTPDAMGMNLLRKAGMRLMIVTGENSPIVSARARKLKIDDVYLAVDDKESLLERLLAESGLTWENLAYVGDDLNDLDVIQKAGFSACPSDSAVEVRRAAKYVCCQSGGHGAVREACDLLRTYLAAKNVPSCETADGI